MSSKLFLSVLALILGSFSAFSQYSYNGSTAHNFKTKHGYIYLGPSNSGWGHVVTDRSRFYFNKDIYTGTNGFSSYNNDLLLKTKGTTRLRIDDIKGNVGIGVTPLTDVRLYVNSNYKVGISSEVNHTADYQFGIISAVNRNKTKAFSVLLKGSDGEYSDTFAVMGNGDVRAQEVNVIVPIFPDYVFREDYQLKTLFEVETFINTYGHLEDIPTEQEVLKDGLDLGKLNVKLLEKIEELTLYTIQQQKELEKLKQELNDLKNDIQPN